MTDPLTPNYKNNVGRLATDRFDFQKHVDGELFRHKSNQIDLSASIDGYSWATVQDALEALASLIAPPIIPDATVFVKGIVQLAGDISGTATAVVVAGLRGRPITNAIPATNEVLTWNGTAWSPAATTGFTAGGDLVGTSVSQQVVSIAGDGYDVCTINCSDLFFKDTVFPIIEQYSSLTNDGHNFLITAQSSSGLNKKGGNVIISGGIGVTGLGGGVALRAYNDDTNNYDNMIQLAPLSRNPNPRRRVLSLLHPTNLTTTDMPAATGDMVMYIRNTATPPSGGLPTNGTILYSYLTPTGSQLFVQQDNGDNFPIGSVGNPFIWGPAGQQTYSVRTKTTSTTSTPALAFAFLLPDNTATMVEITAVGIRDGYADCLEMVVQAAFTRHAGTPVSLGSVTIGTKWTYATGSTWFEPAALLSGNNVLINTGYVAATTIRWHVVTKITTCSDAAP